MFKRGVKNTEFVKFLEHYIRYKHEIFSVNSNFIGLSNDMALCCRLIFYFLYMFKQGVNNTDFVNFLEDYNRYRIELFRVRYFLMGYRLTYRCLL